MTVAVTFALTRGPETTPHRPAPTASPTPADADGDGLTDKIETAGWVGRDGVTYRTKPDDPDTDGDRLTDGDEAGKAVTDPATKAVTYRQFSNPLVKDTDHDGLLDDDEADSGLDAFDADTDNDKLSDAREVQVLGTAPDVADTDGDGLNDGYEDKSGEVRGLDPLVFDVKITKRAYTTDFAKGAVLGDLNREDTIAWLLGNLTSGGSSLIPGVGWIVGTVADVRDLIGSVIRADWVGSGISAVGVVPDVGDAVAIPTKTAKFVARNPELAAGVAAAVVALHKVPESIKVQTVKRLWSDWDDLKAAGASDKALLKLSSGRTNLDKLALAMKRTDHIPGAPAKFFADGPAGEVFLEDLLRKKARHVATQVPADTRKCVTVYVVCNPMRREFDVLADGVAHESKVGFRYMSPKLEAQIRADAYLVKTGEIEGAHWHFFASGVTDKVGADKKVLDLLDDLDIPYTIHLPARP